LVSYVDDISDKPYHSSSLGRTLLPSNKTIPKSSGMNYIDRSNRLASKHPIPSGSPEYMVLATLSLFDESSVPVALLFSVLDANALSTVLSSLLSKSLLLQDPTQNTFWVDPAVRNTFRSELSISTRRSQQVGFALRVLNEGFSAQLAQARSLRRARNIHLHVSSVLETVMTFPPNLRSFEEAAELAVAYCMYLLTIGHYSRVLGFIATFQEWCNDLRRSHIEARTALRGKEAVAHASQGNLNTALRLFRHLHRSRQGHVGKSNICTVHSINGLGIVYHALGDYRRASRHHRNALAKKTILLGADDPDTLVSVNNLGLVLQSQGDHQAAENLFSRSLNGWLQAYGADDLFVIAARSNMGIALHLQGKLYEAEDNHRYVYKERHRILGSTHHETVKSKANLAITVKEQGWHAQAAVLYREALAAFQEGLGHSHPDTLKTHTNLATALHDQGKFKEAKIIVTLAIPLIRAKYRSSHAETLEAMEFRSILLQHLGEFTKAHGVATEVYEARKEKLGYDHDDTQRSLQHVIDLAEDCEEAHVLRSFPTSTLVAAV
jgi:tetratricopeptide (TPR) repeat protein